ncbi:hypothetical protein IDH44_12090 [Paenibacillus sp. IB182496]|uniref:Uncharacterized protein n=1 Tax=Paenibacillus sabuli TaxID=2772509 RepID=A0A927BUK5_9BACL|nr:hypothetical protein [Paenibacillus sabuli]MBD2845935.1 hypothetical protein [Paenibacillus sabuli]
MRRARPRRIRTIVLITLAVALVLATTAALVLYWQLRSADLDEIRQRQLLAEQTDAAADDGAIPPLLEEAVEQAGTLTDEPIGWRDALDVAAILMQSELTMGEMRQLMGQSTETLTTAEKQAIRELLLAKLSDEELETLRAITSRYGKYLVIADPDYPIEAVGVMDEAERARIVAAHRDEAQSGAPDGDDPDAAGTGAAPDADRPSTSSGAADGRSGSGQMASETASSSEAADAAAQPEREATAAPGGGADAAPGDSGATGGGQSSEGGRDEQDEQRRKLAATYENKLQQLKSSCTQQSQTLIAEAASELENAAEGQSIEAIGGGLLDKVSEAEGECDTKFNALLSEARQAFEAQQLSFEKGESWKREYAAAKAEIRSAAIAKLQGLL